MVDNSFLPEDYLVKRAEKRTNYICLALFAIVMTAVFGAFLVTNRQWTQVKAQQSAINLQYQDAAKQIQELSELEKQRDEMLNKAELAAALVERVPRSILLAELINRMPAQLGVLEFDLKSDRRQPVRSNVQRNEGPQRISGNNRPATREQANESLTRIEPPQYLVSLSMVGAAPTDLEVSRYMAELNAYPLLRDVTLVYSEQKEIQGRQMRQFRISMTLAPQADVRQVKPLVVPRGLRNPMSDELLLQPPSAQTSAADSDGRN